MNEILQASKNERMQYFQEAIARSSNIKNPIIIEKDFWVCWTLEKIFINPMLSPHIIFKGGTSLSKCYNLINRFSEDIDLTLSKPYIGITYDNDPASATTTNQRGNRLEKLTEQLKNKITNDVKPLLTEEFKKDLAVHFNDAEWLLEIDKQDEQNKKWYGCGDSPRVME